MSFRPYLYQLEGIELTEKARKQGKKRGLLVMASGLGKTVTVAFIIKRLLELRGGQVLYLCHQNDILEQAKATFEAILDSDHTFGFFHGHEKTWNQVTCLFASFQTMGIHKDHFDSRQFSYIVVDESHHGPARTYRPTLQYFRPNFLLGITATPERTDLQDIRAIYGRELFSLPLEDALARGLLTPVDYRLMDDEIQNLPTLDTPLGKLKVSELNKKLFIPRRDEEIARIIRRTMAEMHNPRVMIFCPSVQHCNELRTFLPHSLAVHYKLPPREQKAYLDAFRRGLVNTVLTVDKFNEGIDVPEANIIVFLRSTSSRMLFLQQLGRGLRKFPGKQRVIVLDFVANCEHLELVHELNLMLARRRRYLGQTRKGGEAESLVKVDIGEIHFSQESRQILKVIKAVRAGYSKERLISELRELASKLGRFPKAEDIVQAHKAGDCASLETYKRAFGTFPHAVRTAKLWAQYKSSLTVREVEQLKPLAAWIKEHGRLPSEDEIRQASESGRLPSLGVLRQVFGTLHRAFNRARQFIKDEEEKPKLIEQLQNLAKGLGGGLFKKQVERAARTGKCANIHKYERIFGSFEAAMEAAGLTYLPLKRRIVSYSKPELIHYLKGLGRRLGRTPSGRDVAKASREGRGPGEDVFIGVFGSVVDGQKQSGFDTSQRRKTTLRYTDQELLEQLRKLASTLGRRPSRDDVEESSRKGACASTWTFGEHFGSLQEALKQAGI